jgi:hypothetical protein
LLCTMLSSTAVFFLWGEQAILFNAFYVLLPSIFNHYHHFYYYYYCYFCCYYYMKNYKLGQYVYPVLAMYHR